MNIHNIKLDELSTDIFSEIAKEAAEHITAVFTDKEGREKEKDVNKSAQLRKFYDELVMWHDKVALSKSPDEAYRRAAPFIQMLKAKAAYSEGRGHVDKNFTDVFNQIIGQIKDPATLRHAKLFFEAVLGFRKALEK